MSYGVLDHLTVPIGCSQFLAWGNKLCCNNFTFWVFPPGIGNVRIAVQISKPLYISNALGVSVSVSTVPPCPLLLTVVSVWHNTQLAGWLYRPGKALAWVADWFTGVLGGWLATDNPLTPTGLTGFTGWTGYSSSYSEDRQRQVCSSGSKQAKTATSRGQKRQRKEGEVRQMKKGKREDWDS